jgi:hypothetical protein
MTRAIASTPLKPLLPMSKAVATASAPVKTRATINRTIRIQLTRPRRRGAGECGGGDGPLNNEPPGLTANGQTITLAAIRVIVTQGRRSVGMLSLSGSKPPRSLRAARAAQAMPTAEPAATMRHGCDTSPVSANVQRSVKLVCRERLPDSTAVVSRSSR